MDSCGDWWAGEATARQTDRAFSTAPSGIRHCAWRAGVPGGSSRHAAAAVCRTSPANYCTVRAHDGPGERRYDDEDDAGINYPIAAVGLFPVSDVYSADRRRRRLNAARRPSHGCPRCAARCSRLGASARRRIVMKIIRTVGVYGWDQYKQRAASRQSMCCVVERWVELLSGRLETRAHEVSFRYVVKRPCLTFSGFCTF